MRNPALKLAINLTLAVIAAIYFATDRDGLGIATFGVWIGFNVLDELQRIRKSFDSWDAEGDAP